MEPVEIKPLPPREALEYFRSKGYAPALQRFDYRDHWREEHARNFVVAKAMQDDVLGLIRNRFEEALAEGTTLKKFQSDLQPALKSKGWWGRGIERDPLTGELQDVQLGSMHRLKVIYDTNMRTSYAAGQWARLQRTKDFLPYLEYRQIDRETAREAHKPFDGLILPIDHPIWLKIFPPNGWFCGCSVRAVNDRMLRREGKSVTTEGELAELNTLPWTNPRTGQTEDLLEGLDPAFASNPGAAWLNTEDRHAASALDLPDDIAAYDRGYLRELAALRLRDGRDAALVYDRFAPVGTAPFGMTRAALSGDGTAELSPAMRRALDSPEIGAVLLRGRGAGSGITVGDFRLMGRSPALDQVALSSPDGSIFRIGRIASAALPDADDLERTFADLRRATAARAPALGLGARDIELLAQHVLALRLQEAGLIRYAAAPGGSVAQVFARAAELIARLLAFGG